MTGKMPNTDKKIQLKNSGKRAPGLNEPQKMEGEVGENFILVDSKWF